MPHNFRKLISLFLSFCLILEQSVFAQSIDLSHYFANSGKPVLQSDKFRPLHLRYMGYDNLNQDFKLLLDKGDTKKVDLENKNYIEENTQTLLKYFFIGLALPNEKFWVNLRPDAPDNIIDDDVAMTDIGRIFLEADVQLKKDTASFTSPQAPEGKVYWDKLYKKAEELFGTENITIPTLTRPWIVPSEIIIRESPEGAYIYKATLKVMLEEDYLRGMKDEGRGTIINYSFKDPRLKQLNEYSTQLIRELIIPKLTYQVNTSKRYAPLRQAYYSLILAQWFKARFGEPVNGLASKPVNPLTGTPDNHYSKLIDSNDLTNLASKELYDKQTYFQQYQKSFQDGEYNLTEPVYTPMGQNIRRYVSGGMGLGKEVSLAIEVIKSGFNHISQSSYLKNSVYHFSSSPLKNNESGKKNDHASLVSLLRDPLNAPKDLPGKARKIIEDEEAIKELLGVKDIKGIAYEIEQEEDYSGGYVLRFIVDTESGKMSFYTKLRHSSGTTEEIIKRKWPEYKIKVTQADPDGDWARYKVEGYENEFMVFRPNPTTLEYKMTVEASQEGIVPPSCIIADSLIVRGVDNGISLEKIFYGYGENENLRELFLNNKKKFVTEIGKAYGILNKKLNIVHGDIKLEHIFITEDKVYLIDFSAREPDEDGFLSRRVPNVGKRSSNDSDLARLISVFPYEGAGNVYKQWLEKGYGNASSAVKDDFNLDDGSLCRIMPLTKDLAGQRYNEILDLVNLVVGSNWEKDKLMEEYSGKWQNSFVVIRDKKIIAILLAYEQEPNAELKIGNRHVFIRHLCVTEEFRRKHIAAYLLNYLSSQVKAKGYRPIVLQTNVDNAEANLLYRKLDFKNIATIKAGEDIDNIYVIDVIELFRNTQSVVAGSVNSGTDMDSLRTEADPFGLERVNYLDNVAKGKEDLPESLKTRMYSLLWPVNMVKPEAHISNFQGLVLKPASVSSYRDHPGIDIQTFPGDKVFAAAEGVVVYVDDFEKNGKISDRRAFGFVDVYIYSPDKQLLICYVHLDKKSVPEDILRHTYFDILYSKVKVRAGEIIGAVKAWHTDPAFSDNAKEEILPAKVKEYYERSYNHLHFEVLYVDDPDKLNSTFSFSKFKSINPLLLLKPLYKIEEQNDSASEVEESLSSSSIVDDKGGVAFNALPIQTEAVASSALGAFSGVKAFQGDLDAEWAQIQQIFNAGIRPSIQRIGEYTAAATASPLAEEKIDEVRAMLTDLLRREEEDEKLPATEPILKNLITALES